MLRTHFGGQVDMPVSFVWMQDLVQMPTNKDFDFGGVFFDLSLLHYWRILLE